MEKLWALGIDGIELAAADVLPLSRVRAETRLPMPDAVASHTAERAGAALATTDAAVARAAGARSVPFVLASSS